jgi:hypothetical protein
MSFTNARAKLDVSGFFPLFLLSHIYSGAVAHGSGRRRRWGVQSAPSIACLWAVAFALNKLTTSIRRRFAPIANSQGADRVVRKLGRCLMV